MKLKRYIEQRRDWPSAGRHILAGHDEHTIVVYQAYRPGIGLYAASHQKFGGEFSFSRMSWIKTNFLWMMYRSGWGTKENQEITLAITIPRSLFDEMLAQAVPSIFDGCRYSSEAEWKQALSSSEVRLQWDPDHGPDGAPQQRRAVQLGLRGDMLKRYAVTDVIRIDDISGFVAEQRRSAADAIDQLVVPLESIYVPAREDAIAGARLDGVPDMTNP